MIGNIFKSGHLLFVFGKLGNYKRRFFDVAHKQKPRGAAKLLEIESELSFQGTSNQVDNGVIEGIIDKNSQPPLRC